MSGRIEFRECREFRELRELGKADPGS